MQILETILTMGSALFLKLRRGYQIRVRGRIEGPTFHSDWSLDWGESKGNITFRLTIIQEAVEQQFTVLSVVSILTDEEGDACYHRLRDAQGTEVANTETISLVIRTLMEQTDLRIILSDQFEKFESYPCIT